MRRVICPTCQLLLAGRVRHNTPEDCVRALRGRLALAETRRSAAQAEQSREKARRRAAQERTVPAVVRRMERIEAENNRLWELLDQTRSRADFLVAEFARLAAQVESEAGGRMPAICSSAFVGEIQTEARA